MDLALDGLYFVVNIILLNIASRICSYLKEYKYYRNHYPVEKRFFHIFNFTFYYNWKSSIIIAIILMIACSYVQNVDFIVNASKHFHLAVLATLFYEGFNIKESKLNLANFIRSGKGLDYATGMASNYFHGYLHLQLPDHGGNFTGLEQRMEIYESTEHVQFAIKKLFILIPHSLQTKPKLCSKVMEKAAPLETVILGRAGVERPFKNDVYKFIHPLDKDKKIYYIAVEGATPLLSYFEAMTNKLTGTPEMEEMSREILLQFYKSIKKYTLNSLGTRNEVEIVYYHDVVDGREIDVGKVLRRQIRDMLHIVEPDEYDDGNDFYL